MADDVTNLNVWCLSGLGNRMRSLLGAKELSEQNGWGFSYTWDARSASLTASLDDLWKQDLVRTSPLSVTLRNLPKREFLQGDMRTWPIDAEKRRRIEVKTGEYILDRQGQKLDWGKQLRSLDPSEEVSQRIAQVSDELGSEEFVGVMIRAHEATHPKTKEFSPVSWYEARMNSLLESRPNLRFFISCDVAEVSDALVKKFPAAVTQRSKGQYNTTVGTQAAVADLYMLGSACGILRPYWSSFTTMASELSNHAVLLEDSQSDVALDATTLVPRAPDALRPWQRLR